jgi:hypothetical protein
MKRAFHGGHSLHGASMVKRKSPAASVRRAVGQTNALGRGKSKRSRINTARAKLFRTLSVKVGPAAGATRGREGQRKPLRTMRTQKALWRLLRSGGGE